jgi:DNA-binding NarL/FixJ family response regulator
MPKKDGIEVIKEFTKKGYPCKVIILSSYDDLKIIQEVMKLGVSGYLTKQCAGEILWKLFKLFLTEKNIFVILLEKKYSIPQQKNNSKLNKENSIVDSILTGRELEIIILIALEHSGKVSEKLFISTNTVETHRKTS